MQAEIKRKKMTHSRQQNIKNLKLQHIVGQGLEVKEMPKNAASKLHLK
jgi:hypothetical protein